MDLSDNSKGLMSLLDICFNKLYFVRSDSVEDNSIDFNRKIAELGNSTYRILLSCSIAKRNSYLIDIDISGDFQISDDIDFKDSLIKNNATAILFPYLRSQITLLTSQPYMESLVLPTFNINNMFND